MKHFIAIVLCASLAFAATINQECRTSCVTECMEVGSKAAEADDCTMGFGPGPNGMHWFVDQSIGGLETCKESCEAICEVNCDFEVAGSDTCE